MAININYIHIPIYLNFMVCIASILMLKIKYNKSKIFNITLGILISVIIYYINHFFNVIIETRNIPYFFSIWGPQNNIYDCYHKFSQNK